jgi:hypothetical protein
MSITYRYFNIVPSESVSLYLRNSIPEEQFISPESAANADKET